MIGSRFLGVFKPLVLLQVVAATEPDFVEKYKKLEKKAKRILDTLELHHAKAYTHAAGEHLMDKEGDLDYEKLDDEDTRSKFADTMAKFYTEQAAKRLKSGAKPEDQFENALLMKAVYGTTQEEIRRAIAAAKKDYTIGQHLKGSKELIEKVGENLAGVSTAHITEKHIDDILRYTKAEEAAKSLGYEFKKDIVDRNIAIGLMANYEDAGYLTKRVFDRLSPVFKKKKK